MFQKNNNAKDQRNAYRTKIQYEKQSIMSVMLCYNCYAEPVILIIAVSSAMSSEKGKKGSENVSSKSFYF